MVVLLIYVFVRVGLRYPIIVGMNENNDSVMLQKLRRLLAEKGDGISPSDLLVPEMEWIINCTMLSATDRKFAELRFLHGEKAKVIMEELQWYSTKTFTSHNKKVWAKLVQTLHRLVD